MASINKLRERIGIYKIEADQPDGIGGSTIIRTLEMTVWARVERLTGARALDMQRVDNTTPYRATMRAGSYDLTVDNILDWNGQELTIVNVVKDEVNRFTIAMCNG